MESSKKERLGLKGSYQGSFLRFLIASVVGIFIFFIPINGVLPFEIIYKQFFLKIVIGKYALLCLTVAPIIMTIGYIYGKKFAKEGSFLYRFFEGDGKFQFILYLVASVFAIMYYFKIGSPLVYHEKTGGVMIGDTLNYTLSIIPIGGAVLPLLASYGLLEVIGGLLEPLMRPVFKVPGKSALDTVASIVGAAVVGILFTAKLYKDNQYTNREAFFIASNFSLNSVGYCAFLLGYVGILNNFGLIFLLYALVTYVMAVLIVRIPPIRMYPDTYANGRLQTDEDRKEQVKFGIKQLKKSFDNAVIKADSAKPIWVEVGQGFLSGIGLTLKVIPTIMSIGIIGLMISEFTPILKYISMPFVPIVSLLQIPEPQLAAQAVFAGGIDLFLPSVFIAGVANEATRFFVVMVSLVQVLYITETMLPIKQFGIPVKMRDVFIVWLERTLVAMPLIAILTHILY